MERGAIPPDALERLHEYASCHPEIEAVFLFGSVARGESRPDSDLDIAVLLDRNAYEDGVDVLRLMSDMTDVFARSDVDVAVLNGASPLLMHRVVRDGHVLYAVSNRAVAEFHLYAVQQYEDTRPLREAQYQRLLRQIAEGEANAGQGA